MTSAWRAVVHEVLAHRAARVRRDVLQRRRVRRGGRDDDRVLHRAVLLERLDDLRDRRVLLPDRDVDADDVLALLVDDRVERDGRLAGLAVADDELALAAADRDHRVDRLDAGLHRLLDGHAVDDAGREALDGVELLRGDRPLAVQRDAERVHDAADERVPDGHGHDALRALGRVAFLHVARLAHEDAADVRLLEVQREAEDVVRKRDELAGHGLVEPVDERDAVADRDDRADLVDVHALRDARELGLDELGDFLGAD